MKWVLACLMICACTFAAASAAKIPVILDTDIGDDIDDTWALCLMLESPELDVKLVVSDNGAALYRAKLIAKLLTVAGRTDIPVGIGLDEGGKPERQGEWVKDYDLAAYPGTVHKDGVGALIDTIMAAPEPITLVCIGPVQNIGAALEREPRIAQKARFVGMHGSVRRGYGGSSEISAEWNVRCAPAACQKALSAAWPITITPLDTCGLVHLRGEKYAAVRDCTAPLTAALIENYRIWAAAQGDRAQAESASSTLYDTVAVYLAFSQDLVKMERLPIRVTDDGYTRIDEQAGTPMNVAVEWKDMGAFEDLLVRRLTH